MLAESKTHCPNFRRTEQNPPLPPDCENPQTTTTWRPRNPWPHPAASPWRRPRPAWPWPGYPGPVISHCRHIQKQTLVYQITIIAVTVVKLGTAGSALHRYQCCGANLNKSNFCFLTTSTIFRTKLSICVLFHPYKIRYQKAYLALMYTYLVLKSRKVIPELKR